MPLTARNTLVTPASSLDAAAQLSSHLSALRHGTGVEAVPPGDVSDAEQERFVARVRAACGWLRLLGYTHGTLPCTRPDAPPLLEALARFRHDAGIATRGGLDDDTWTALWTLVSFDSVTDVVAFHYGRSKKDPRRPRPALQRAILLRLNVLQHMQLLPYVDMPATQLDEAMRQGLVSFSRLLGELGVPAAERRSRLRVERWLFDHEAQVRVTRDWMRSSDAADLGALKGTPAWPFVHGLARVELYLRDHDVGRLDDTKLDGTFWRALRDERQRHGLASRPRARRADLALFERWCADQNRRAEPDALLEREHHLHLQQAIARIPAEVVEAEWKRQTNRRFRLWDGLRRAVRWVVSAIQTGIDWLVEQVLKPMARGLTLLVRWLFRSACQVVTAVQDATLAVVRVLSGPLKSDGGVTRLYPDFDMDTFVSASASAPGHATFVTHTLKGFTTAMRIVAWIADLLVLAATGGWTWLRLLRGLVMLLRDLKRRGAELQLLSEFPVPAVHHLRALPAG